MAALRQEFWHRPSYLRPDDTLAFWRRLVLIVCSVGVAFLFVKSIADVASTVAPLKLVLGHHAILLGIFLVYALIAMLLSFIHLWKKRQLSRNCRGQFAKHGQRWGNILGFTTA